MLGIRMLSSSAAEVSQARSGTIPQFKVMNVAGASQTAGGFQWFPLSSNDGNPNHTGWAALLDANTGLAATNNFIWNFTRIKLTASSPWRGAPNGYIYLPSAGTQLSAPTINSPGDTSAPGPVLTTLTPQFTWTAVNGATGYGLYIRDTTTNTLVFNNDGGVKAGTSYSLPAGYLTAGHSFRWAMTSFNGTVEGDQGSYRYFQTPAGTVTGPTASEISSYIDSLSQQYRVPAVVIKALVQQESRWNVNANNPEPDGRVGMGLTQVTLFLTPQSQQVSLGLINVGSQGSNPFVTTTETVTVDVTRLQTDWQYNLEIGVRWLVRMKVEAQGAGDDASVIENWYYPLLYYNGAGGLNDPSNSFSRSVNVAADWMKPPHLMTQVSISGMRVQHYRPDVSESDYELGPR